MSTPYASITQIVLKFAVGQKVKVLPRGVNPARGIALKSIGRIENIVLDAHGIYYNVVQEHEGCVHEHPCESVTMYMSEDLEAAE